MRRLVHAFLYWLPVVLLVLVMLAGMTLTLETLANDGTMVRTLR